MNNQTFGTKEQNAQMTKALEELKKVPGPVMKAMQSAQDIYGCLPFEVQNQIAEALDVPLEEVYGIATFYSQFHLKPSGKYKIGVCLGTACYVRGAGDIMDNIRTKLGIEAGETTDDAKFTLEATRCIGCCGLAPVLTVNEEVYGKVVPEDIDKILSKYNG